MTTTPEERPEYAIVTAYTDGYRAGWRDGREALIDEHVQRQRDEAKQRIKAALRPKKEATDG